jgi:hypothetical protein
MPFDSAGRVDLRYVAVNSGVPVIALVQDVALRIRLDDTLTSVDSQIGIRDGKALGRRKRTERDAYEQ